MQNMTGDYTSSWRSHEIMDWCWTRRCVKSSSLDMFTISTEPIQIHWRSLPSRRCLPYKGIVTYLMIHPTTIFSYSKTAEDWCGILFKCNISSHIWLTEIIGMWGHYTEAFQYDETGNNQSWCIWQGTPIQDDSLVTSTSKVLITMEQCYTNNERKLLTYFFGAECFWPYVFGRHFIIESDYKSLEQISMKNLADASVHLQRMLLWLQDYDFTIKYHLGEEMVVAHTLLIYSTEDTLEIFLDISVNHIYIDAEKKWDYKIAIKNDPL